MHLTDALIVRENAYPKGLQNIIVDIFDVVLKDRTVIPTHAIYHIKPDPNPQKSMQRSAPVTP